MMTETKVVLLGDGGVGKTAILSRFKGNPREKRYIPTVGCEVHPLNYNMKHYTVWDTAGQEKYAGNAFQSYLTGANVVLLVYDVTSRISYKNLQRFYDMAKTVEPTALCIVVANKMDCEDKMVETPTFHLANNLPFFEVSSKTNNNISQLHEYIQQYI